MSFQNAGGQSSVLKCPNTHNLSLFVSPLSKCCPFCAINSECGSRMWRCFPCDFHVCQSCHDNLGNRSKPMIAPPCAPKTCEPMTPKTISSDTDSIPVDISILNPGWVPCNPFKDRDEKECKELKELIKEWMETPVLQLVKPRMVIPDSSNRGHTGLSVEHVHNIAKSFNVRGFEKRIIDKTKGHDVPVVVRENPNSILGKLATSKWIDYVKDAKGGFPTPEINDPLFTSLGNGHFFQALNAYRVKMTNPWTNRAYEVPEKDDALKEAIEVGVPSLVLKKEMPLPKRIRLSELLNAKCDYRWDIDFDLDENLRVDLDELSPVDLDLDQFDLLSKTLDGFELNCLVRQAVGVTDETRVGQ